MLKAPIIASMRNSVRAELYFLEQQVLSYTEELAERTAFGLEMPSAQAVNDAFMEYGTTLCNLRQEADRLDDLYRKAEARDRVIHPLDERFVALENEVVEAFDGVREAERLIRHLLARHGYEDAYEQWRVVQNVYKEAQDGAKAVLKQLAETGAVKGGKYGTTGAFQAQITRKVEAEDPLLLIDWLVELLASEFISEKEKDKLRGAISFGAEIANAIEHDEYQTAYGPAPATVKRTYSAKFAEDKLPVKVMMPHE